MLKRRMLPLFSGLFGKLQNELVSLHLFSLKFTQLGRDKCDIMINVRFKLISFHFVQGQVTAVVCFFYSSK